jgi:8-oxo-dGTP pyrophosphatase MutT (NUDIX family)
MHKKLGVLLQPGGHVELTETPWQAVLHEITEETGFDLAQLHLLQPKVRIKTLRSAVLHPQPLVHNTHHFDPEGVHKHSDISYAFLADGVPSGVPDEGESLDQRWLSFDEIQQLSSTEVYDNVRDIAKYLFQDVLGKFEAVELPMYES